MARDRNTLDLFGWRPPEAAAFKPDEIRASTLAAKLCQAMKIALKDCGLSRDAVALRMAEYLGEPSLSKAMLDAYVSQARETHSINVPRYLALVHATGDMRLLGVLAEIFDRAVVERRYVAAIEDAICDDKIEELVERKKRARRQWKGPR